ncbi:hypothetical protein [Bifidobacterium sp. ESL0790]|uniref:hypothetical protein n=1 Tax=Bifidobacterium sp. ESL0790 TaxID=2983233 RepID=UPI0023F9B0A5|nr:hypothetical protein [Bifidobacterium sp. ESL0790]WEV73067.1 hypothetical protein OZY47_03735 [Bifidobacterium sp. ESL0790]
MADPQNMGGNTPAGENPGTNNPQPAMGQGQVPFDASAQGSPYGAPQQDAPVNNQVPPQPTMPDQAGQVPPQGQMPYSGQPAAAPYDAQAPQGGQPGQPGYAPEGMMPGADGVPPMQGGMPVEPKKGMSKTAKIVITAVIAVVVVVAVVLGLDVAGVIGGPKEKDYKAAQAEISQMEHTFTSMTADFVTASYSAGGDGISQDELTQFKSSMKKNEQANQTFKSLKVMKDPKVKAAYDAYVPKANSFNDYMGDLIKSMQDLSNMKDACTNNVESETVSNHFYQAYDTYISGCQAKIQDAGKVPNKPVADFMQSMQDYLNKKNGVLKQMEALGDPDTFTSNAQIDQVNALVDQFNAIQPPTESATTLQDAITKDVDGIDPTSKLNTLKTAVDNGARAKRGSVF